MPTLSLSEWAQHHLAAQKPALALRCDQSFSLCDFQGQPEHYGLQLQRGEDLRPALPFLYGLEAEPQLTLRDLVLNDEIVDLCLETQQQERYLLLSDARARHAAVQVKQQERNQIELLQRQLQQALDDARRANQAKSRFIAAMSHEFRTPITAIQGYGQRLKASYADSQDADAIGRGCEHLLALVENLLDHGRLDTGEVLLQKRPACLREMGALLIEFFRPLCDQRGLELLGAVAAGLPDWVEIDATRVRQIAINLLGNACKFTHQGRVSFDISWADSVLQLTVEDTGPGIPAEDQERVFAAFERVDEAAPGVGLGLSISRQLAERMGGQLRLSSRPGEGCRFQLQVPAPLTQAPQTTLGSASSALEVVLAEDDPLIGQLLSLILEEAGHEVHHYTNGRDAAAHFETRSADRLVTDLRLPGLDGIALIAAVRQLCPQCAVITLSASANAQDREAALQAGADRFLSKPVPPELLLSALSEVGA